MKAKDLMIPVYDCARVAEDRSIYDAFLMLEAWRQRSDRFDYKPRVVLVYDRSQKIIGSLRHAGMLRALAMHKVSADAGDEGPGRIQQQADVWRDVLASLNETAKSARVKEFMHVFGQSEYLDQNAPIEEALAVLLSGPYQNLVLTADSTTIGILRLSDVFSMICKEAKRFGMK